MIDEKSEISRLYQKDIDAFREAAIKSVQERREKIATRNAGYYERLGSGGVDLSDFVREALMKTEIGAFIDGVNSQLSALAAQYKLTYKPIDKNQYTF